MTVDTLHLPVELHLLGRSMRLTNQGNPEDLDRAVEILEQTFRDMEGAYRLKWGCPPAAVDTSTWLAMGALNLAHRLVRVEQDATRHTQDLEQTLSKLLDDVPDDVPTPATFLGEPA